MVCWLTPANWPPGQVTDRYPAHDTFASVDRDVDGLGVAMLSRACLRRVLGRAGDVDAETNGLLLQNGIDTSPFDGEVLQCVPSDSWQIPAEEIAKRRDLRVGYRVCTIDPATAKDLDDALHIRKTGEASPDSRSSSHALLRVFLVFLASRKTRTPACVYPEIQAPRPQTLGGK